MINCPHTCNPDVAKALGADRSKGIQCGIQRDESCQAGGRSEMQQLKDSFHMGERLPKVVIGNEGVVDNLPTIIVCEKIEKTSSCQCIEPDLQNLPPCVKKTVEKEASLKKERAMNCLLYKAQRLVAQMQEARKLNVQLNQQMVDLIQQQNSCPYSCDKPIRVPCPPVPTCPSVCLNEMQKSYSPPCKQNTDECPGPCNESNTDEATKFINRLEKILQTYSKPNKSVCPNTNQGMSKMLHSCEGPCNSLKQQLECQGPCNTSVTLDCFGPCSSKPNKAKNCDGPCNIEGLKNKIASLAQVPELCDKMKNLLSECYFNKDNSPLIRYNSLNYKQKHKISNSQVPKCSALPIRPVCPATKNFSSTCPTACNPDAVARQIDEMEAKLKHLTTELTKVSKETEQLEAERILLHCVKTSPPKPAYPTIPESSCPAHTCPPKPCPASQNINKKKIKCSCGE